MRIGILTYHAACNFGANLQVLSTIEYLKNQGYTPIVINYIPTDFQEFYKNSTPEVEYACFEKFRNDYFPLSRVCTSPKGIADVINEEKVRGVIIGSDAVAQHHPLLERIVFPSKRVAYIREMTSDRLFPNPFWGDFRQFLLEDIPICVMSASSQDSSYRLIPFWVIRRMRQNIMEFDYVSVRDTWTQNMYRYISNNHLNPPVTPDPVFAFNNNVKDYIPDKNYILEKYGLPCKYYLFSFLHDQTVSTLWLKQMESLLNSVGGVCVGLTFPQGMRYSCPFDKQINIPLDPMDWYALIKYSSGYIGHNMHPIVVSLHNNVPFFSFDNYGTTKLNGFYVNDASSKIKHILEKAGLGENRISCIRRNFISPSPQYVFNKLQNFEVKSSSYFAEVYYSQYSSMMDDILKIFKKCE